MLFKHAVTAAAFGVAVVVALPRPATIIPRSSPSDNEYYRPIIEVRSAEPEPEPEPDFEDFDMPSHLQPGRFARRLRRRDSDYGNRIRRNPIPPFEIPEPVIEPVAELKEQLVVIRDDLEDKVETAEEALQEVEELARRSQLKEEIRHQRAEEAIEIQKREALEDIAVRSQFAEDALVLAKRLIEEELERVSKAKLQARSVADDL